MQCYAHYIHYLIHTKKKLHEMHTITSNLQMEKLRFRERMTPAQGHVALSDSPGLGNTKLNALNHYANIQRKTK